MKKSEEVLRLIDSVGNFIEYWGFKKLHGKIWTLVFISREPISTPQIVEFLGVSKGMVSVALNELLEFGLIERGHKVEHGAVTYTADEAQVAAVVRGVLKNRELLLIADSMKCLDQLNNMPRNEMLELGLSVKKIKAMTNLTESCQNLLQKIIRRKLHSITDWVRLFKTARVLKKS